MIEEKDKEQLQEHDHNNENEQIADCVLDNLEKPIVKRTLFRKIVNAFIMVFLGMVIALLVLFGFTQTKTFRNLLQEKVIELANTELNGKLNIERIDGTLFTSIFLRNTSIVMEKDTLLFANNIEVKTSPLQLLLKKIYLRKIFLNDVKIQMLEDANGEWNFSKLIKSKPEDTTKTSFSFMIQVNDLQLNNINFIRQSFGNYKSNKIYPTLNFDDLRIEHLNFSAQAFADLHNSNYLLILNEFTFKPNVARFNLRYISGEFAVTKEFASVKNFYLLTDSSEIRINARIDSLNIFSNIVIKDFENYPVTVELKATPFNFDDLSSFIYSTEILKGSPSFDLKARGKFGSFRVERLSLDYRDTHIEGDAQILNLNTPENLFIRAKVRNTDINYKDVNLLLPSLELPEYAKLILRGVNIEYEGEPTNFKTKFISYVDEGKLTCQAAMNVGIKPMTYDIKFETENLNLHPILGVITSLNSEGIITGKGISPADLAADLKLNIFDTTVDEVTIEKFNLHSKAKDSNIDLYVDAKSENAETSLKGSISFDNDTIPSYSLAGRLNKLDLSKFIKEELYESNLNFIFSAEGKNLDPDEINARFSLTIESSQLRDKKIDRSSIEATFKKDSTHREIILTSDLADFKINGNFSLKKAVELITFEANTISKIVADKLNELNPLAVIQQEDKKDSVSIGLPEIANADLTLDYEFKIKDFELIAMLLGKDQLNIAGSGSGSISNQAPNFSVSTELKLDYLVMLQKGSTIYLSDILADFNFTRDNRSNSFDKLFGTGSLTGKRFYSGSDIRSINADIIFNQSKMFFNASAKIDDLMNFESEGIIKMTPREQQLLVNNLSFIYDGIEWTNKDTMKVLFNPDYFKIVQCQMESGDALITAGGVIKNSGEQNLSVKATGISGQILEKYFLGYSDDQFSADGSLDAKMNGTFENPVINLLFDLKDLQLASTKLGGIKGTADYSDKKLSASLLFLDEAANANKPKLLLKGNFPIDLSFSSVSERLLGDEPLSIQLKSSRFDMNSLGRIIPGVANQHGILSADVDVSGSFKNPVYSGFINLTEGFFRSTYNNLDYKCGLKLNFEKKGISVDSVFVANADVSKYKGELKGVGAIMLDGFSIEDLELRFFGNLTLLSEQSQSVSPLFYGNLMLETNGDWILTKRGEKYFFKGNTLLKNVNLVYTTGYESRSGASKNFNFVFIEDSTKIDRALLQFQKVLLKEKALRQQTEKERALPLNFNYEIGISIEDNAKLEFILAQAINQKLIVELRGDLKYDSFNGDSRAQGALELLEGSKLEFFKIFDAVGIIRFESDITNPYLDITSTYTSDYINPRDESGTTEDVAIKIKIKGPLSDLGKSLAGNQESISVYLGARNIQNNLRETRYDYADAFSFILFGKFKDDLTAQDKAEVAGQTSLIGNTATSFLGSILTSFVNSTVGDLVNNISISQAGEFTKFSLSGKIQNLRYSFGGTTEVFQNIYKANVKLEYLFGPKFLLRLERKDPLISSFGLGDKITEMALKYKFEF